MSQIGADPSKTKARDLHFALTRKRIANPLHHELGYAVRIMRLQRIFFLHRQRLGHGKSRRIIKPVNGKARSHDQPFHSNGKGRCQNVITYAYVVTESGSVAEHVRRIPGTGNGIESVASVGKPFSGEMDHSIRTLKDSSEVLRMVEIDHQRRADTFRNR